MSLLTRKNARCGVSSSSLSRRSLRVFPSLTWCLATVLYISLSLLRWCLERRTVDSCGNSTCLKTPQSGFLEEAEAVPAESNGPQRKTHALTSQFISTTRWGALPQSQSQNL